MGWQPIETAPRRPHGAIKVRLSSKLAPYHVMWGGSRWIPVEFMNGGPNPTEWFDGEDVCHVPAVEPVEDAR